MLGVESYQPNSIPSTEASNFASLTPVPVSFPIPATAAFSFPKGVEPHYAHHPGFPTQWTPAAAAAAAAAAAGSGIPLESFGLAPSAAGEEGGATSRQTSPPQFLGHYEDESQDGQSSPPAEASAAPETLYNPAPVSPPPQRERFSYTRYQLEVLNGIYNKIRYPNSMQKQLIAKRVGITRDQVKIWFQNRRRKDIVAASKGGKRGKDEIRPTRRMVQGSVMNGVLSELLNYAHDPKGAKLRESMGQKTDTSSKHRKGLHKTPTPSPPPLPLEDEDSMSPQYQPNGRFLTEFAPKTPTESPPANLLNLTPGYVPEITPHSQTHGQPPVMTLAYPTTQAPQQFPPPVVDPIPLNPDVTSEQAIASNPEPIVTVPLTHPTTASPDVDESSMPAGSTKSTTEDTPSAADAESPPNVTIGPNMEVIIPTKEDSQRRAEMKRSPVYSVGSPDTVDSDSASKTGSPMSPLSEACREFMPPNTVAPPSEPLPFQQREPYGSHPHIVSHLLAPPEAPLSISPVSNTDESRDSNESSVGLKGVYEGKVTDYSYGCQPTHEISGTHVGFVHDEAHFQPHAGLPVDPRPLSLDRVFPFQLMADGPAILANLPAYHDPYGAAGLNYLPHSMPYRDPYQPLMIQAYNNPYYHGCETSIGGTAVEPKTNITQL